MDHCPDIYWEWPYGNILRSQVQRLYALTYPITLTELLWGLSTFLYTLLFVRLGTQALAASQIVYAVESVFIVASSGLAAAAITLIGQALGANLLNQAQHQAHVLLRLSVATSVTFGAMLVGTGLLLGVFYPTVTPRILEVAFGGIVINALFQPAKVLNMVLGAGVLSSGGDTRFVLFGDVFSTYAVGLPLAWLLSFWLGFGLWGIFAARVFEEVVKLILLYFRYRTPSWYSRALVSQASVTTA